MQRAAWWRRGVLAPTRSGSGRALRSALLPAPVSCAADCPRADNSAPLFAGEGWKGAVGGSCAGPLPGCMDLRDGWDPFGWDGRGTHTHPACDNRQSRCAANMAHPGDPVTASKPCSLRASPGNAVTSVEARTHKGGEDTPRHGSSIITTAAPLMSRSTVYGHRCCAPHSSHSLIRGCS